MKLLLVSCSQRKNPAPGLLPAFERYTGGVYQVVHRAQREGYWPADCHLVIISAWYGLLQAETLIAFSDRKLSPAQAAFLQPQVSADLDMLLSATFYDTVFLNLGVWYRFTLLQSSELASLLRTGHVWEASGGFGQRLQQTKRWLKEESCPDALQSQEKL